MAGEKSRIFASYEQQLCQWCTFGHAHDKAMAVYNYIQKGQVVADLVQASVLHTDEADKLLAYWPFEVDKDNPIPLIFKVLPALPKEKRKTKINLRLSREMPLFVGQWKKRVRWTAEHGKT